MTDQRGEEIDLYAVAALAGAAVVVIGAALRLPATAMTIAGAVLCFALRFMNDAWLGRRLLST